MQWFVRFKVFFYGTSCEQCHRARIGVKSVGAIAPRRAPSYWTPNLLLME